MMAAPAQPAGKSGGSVSEDRSGPLEPDQIPSSSMFSPLGCACPLGEESASSRRRHQERKLRMLTFWRDGLERQLAAVNAAMATLERQMERDQPAAQG